MIIFSKGWSVDKDGPGRRLIYYLKGCNMRCLWCANPESISPGKQILFYPARAKAPFESCCPRGAVKDSVLDRALCSECAAHDCVTVWRNPVFELAGEEISPEDILREALDSEDLFTDGGGVSFGGGEPSLQAPELLKTLRLLRENDINTTVESNASTPAFKKLIGAPDLLISDFKADNDAVHKEMTGVSNAPVKENLREAARAQRNFLIRIPLVPGLNDSPEEQTRMAEFLSSLGAVRKESFGKPLRVEILTMHKLCAPKHKALGASFPMENASEPGEAAKDGFRKILGLQRNISPV
jgi:pyruvate formate lyase activating enzyme